MESFIQTIDDLINNLTYIKNTNRILKISESTIDQTKRLNSLYNICKTNEKLYVAIDKSTSVKYTDRLCALDDYLPGNILIYFPECKQYLRFTDAHDYEKFVELWLDLNSTDSIIPVIPHIDIQQIVLTSEPQKLIFYSAKESVKKVLQYIKKYLNSTAISIYSVKNNLYTIKVQRNDNQTFNETKEMFNEFVETIRNSGDNVTIQNIFMQDYFSDMSYDFNIYDIGDSIIRKKDDLDILKTLITPNYYGHNNLQNSSQINNESNNESNMNKVVLYMKFIYRTTNLCGLALSLFYLYKLSSLPINIQSN